MEYNMLHELEEVMEEVGAKSSYNGYTYTMSEVLIIMICGLLSGITDINLIHEWSKSANARQLLSKEFHISKIPSRSQLYFILAYVNYEVFAQCFSNWMANMLKAKTKGKVISIDGKTIRSTKNFSNDGNALHVVSAIISEYALIIGSKDCKNKSHEVKINK